MSNEPQPDAARLAAWFHALGSPVRIRLLFALREPTAAGELRITAAQERAALRAERALSRTTLLHHLEILGEAGVVSRLDDGRHVVNQQILFAVLENLAVLARLKPSLALDVGETRANAPRAARPAPDGPRLVAVGGPLDGAPFALAGDGPWIVGRGEAAAVSLAHDPHVSRAHLVVRRERDAWLVEGVAGVTNPALLDQTPLPAATPAPLDAGAVLAVGATRLVFRPK